MSTIAEYVFSTTSADTGLAALVGDRIFPLIAPEGTARPYVVFTMISTVPTESHAGAGERLDETLVQFTIAAETFTALEDVTNALRLALETAAQPVNGSIEVVNIRETFEPETLLFVKQFDANFFHSA